MLELESREPEYKELGLLWGTVQQQTESIQRRISANIQELPDKNRLYSTNFFFVFNSREGYCGVTTSLDAKQLLIEGAYHNDPFATKISIDKNPDIVIISHLQDGQIWSISPNLITYEDTFALLSASWTKDGNLFSIKTPGSSHFFTRTGKIYSSFPRDESSVKVELSRKQLPHIVNFEDKQREIFQLSQFYYIEQFINQR